MSWHLPPAPPAGARVRVKPWANHRKKPITGTVLDLGDAPLTAGQRARLDDLTTINGRPPKTVPVRVDGYRDSSPMWYSPSELDVLEGGTS